MSSKLQCMNSNFTITAEIHARSLVKFYCQYANRHMNLKFMRRVSKFVPWVPEVFFLVGSDRIERRSREGESRSDEKKPLAPTDNNLTSMPTPVSFD